MAYLSLDAKHFPSALRFPQYHATAYTNHSRNRKNPDTLHRSMHPCIRSQVRSHESHFGVVAPVLGCPRVTTTTVTIYTEGAFLIRTDIAKLMG